MRDLSRSPVRTADLAAANVVISPQKLSTAKAAANQDDINCLALNRDHTYVAVGTNHNIVINSCHV